MSGEPNNKYIKECITNGFIHHYDFEFNTTKNGDFPIELGISTYKMDSNRELDSFHIMINSNPPRPFYKDCLWTHGITEQYVAVANKNYVDICNKIINYIQKFDTTKSIWVLKDEKVSGDKICLDFLFKKADKNEV